MLAVIFFYFLMTMLYHPMSLSSSQPSLEVQLKIFHPTSTLFDPKFQDRLKSRFYFNYKLLKSRTLRILLSGLCLSHFGVTVPMFLTVSAAVRLHFTCHTT